MAGCYPNLFPHIFVEGFGRSTHEGELAQLFSNFGRVRHVEIVGGRNSYGIVTLASDDDVERILRAGQLTCRGRRLTIRVTKIREGRFSEQQQHQVASTAGKSAKMHSANQRRVSTDQTAANQGRASTDQTIAIQRRVSSDQTIVNQRRVSSDQTIANQRRPGTDQTIAIQRRANSDQTIDNQRRASSDQTLANQRRVSSDQTIVNQRRASSDQTIVNQRRASSDQTIANQRRADQTIANQRRADQTIVNQRRNGTDQTIATQRRVGTDLTVPIQRRPGTDQTLGNQKRASTDQTIANQRRVGSDQTHASSKQSYVPRPNTVFRTSPGQTRFSPKQNSRTNKSPHPPAVSKPPHHQPTSPVYYRHFTSPAMNLSSSPSPFPAPVPPASTAQPLPNLVSYSCSPYQPVPLVFPIYHMENFYMSMTPLALGYCIQSTTSTHSGLM